MPIASLADRVRLVNAAEDAQRLQALDQVWTQYLAGNVVAADRPALQALVRDMTQLMQNLENESPFLEGLFDQVTDAELDAGLEQAPVSDPDKQRVRDIVAGDGGFR